MVLHDVYDIEGHPRLVEDLGLEDRTTLVNAFDTVVRPEQKVERLWQALCGHRLILRELDPIPGFRDPGTVYYAGTYPPCKVSADEGKELYRQSLERERDRELSRQVKEINKDRYGGRYTCEACGISSTDASLFDAHHLVPLALGQRRTVLSDFAVLCPTCHRVAHRKAQKRHDPMPVMEVRHWLEENVNVVGP